MPIIRTYEIENEKEFNSRLKKVAKGIGVFKEPLNIIADDFYKSQTGTFSNNPGGYAPLSGQYQDRKNAIKSGLPILVGVNFKTNSESGKLRDAVGPKGPGPGGIRIVTDRAAIIGVKIGVIKYAGFVQGGTKKTPARPYLFIGPENRRVATAKQLGRLQRWTNIMEKYAEAVHKKNGFGS